jgi:hypothetical protein
MYSTYDPTHIYVVSIDIGVKHMAIVLSQIEEDFTIAEIVWFNLIDITEFIHLETGEKCMLHHEKTYADYLEHIFLYFGDMFDKARYILIERQPPQGYVVVEQLIFYQYRSKSILISPNSLHYHFGWGKLDYDQRKEASERMANLKLCNTNRTYLFQHLDSLERKHDVTDAICMLIFWTDREHLQWKRNETLKKPKVRLDELDNFKYIKQVKND